MFNRESFGDRTVDDGEEEDCDGDVLDQYEHWVRIWCGGTHSIVSGSR